VAFPDPGKRFFALLAECSVVFAMRQQDGKRRALVGQARDPDLSPMSLDELAGDWQAQPAPREDVGLAPGAVVPETIKDKRQVFIWNAAAAISNLELHPFRGIRGSEPNLASGGRKMQGVYD
jgi:hypothetical protein